MQSRVQSFHHLGNSNSLRWIHQQASAEELCATMACTLVRTAGPCALTFGAAPLRQCGPSYRAPVSGLAYADFRRTKQMTLGRQEETSCREYGLFPQGLHEKGQKWRKATTTCSAGAGAARRNNIKVCVKENVCDHHPLGPTQVHVDCWHGVLPVGIVVSRCH
jgi:hypothetical protein